MVKSGVTHLMCAVQVENKYLKSSFHCISALLKLNEMTCIIYAFHSWNTSLWPCKLCEMLQSCYHVINHDCEAREQCVLTASNNHCVQWNTLHIQVRTVLRVCELAASWKEFVSDQNRLTLNVSNECFELQGVIIYLYSCF